MSSTSLMTLGTQAVFTAYAQLQTTGNNIANANTPGYSRQSVQLVSAGSDYNPSGYMGRGVTVATVTRASNMFLTQQALATASAAAADGVRWPNSTPTLPRPSTEARCPTNCWTSATS